MGIELNGQSLKIVENFRLGDTIGVRQGHLTVIIRIRVGCCKFRDLFPLFASRRLP